MSNDINKWKKDNEDMRNDSARAWKKIVNELAISEKGLFNPKIIMGKTQSEALNRTEEMIKKVQIRMDKLKEIPMLIISDKYTYEEIFGKERKTVKLEKEERKRLEQELHTIYRFLYTHTKILTEEEYEEINKEKRRLEMLINEIPVEPTFNGRKII